MVKRYITFLKEATNSCPRATYDIHINLENRQHAIDEYGYGPLNPSEPSTDFWNKKAEMWDITVKEAKTSKCGNCAAFVTTDDMKKCIIDGRKDKDDEGEKDHFDITVEKANLGYCNIFHFKCAGERTCDAWLSGGPIDNKDI